MQTVEINLATNLGALLKFTNNKNEDRPVDLNISPDVTDAGTSATLDVQPADGKNEWLIFGVRGYQWITPHRG
jgi:hypothetical protein